MKKIIIFLIGVLFSNIIWAQHIYSDTTWERWYGVQNYNEIMTPFNNTIEHYDNGYLYHGRKEYPISPEKPFLKKVDVNGYLLWERTLDSIINKAILYTGKYHDGGILVCGGSFHSGIGNPWIAKLNACMEVEWCKIFDWYQYSSAIDIAEDNNGDIVVLTSGYGEGVNERIGIIKLSPNGTVLWKGDYATMDDYPDIWGATPYKLLISEDNFYYLAIKADWPNNNDPSQGSGTRSIMIKVSPEGNEEWILPMGIYNSLYSKPWTIHQLTDDLFLTIGDNYVTLHPIMFYFNSNGEEISVVNKQVMPDTYYQTRLSGAKMISDTSFFSIWRYKYDIQETEYHYGYIIFDTALNIIDSKEDDRWHGPADLIHASNNKFVTVGSMDENNSSGKRDIYLSKRNLDFSYDSVYMQWPGHYDTLCEEAIVSGYLPYDCDMIVGINEVSTPQEYKEAQEHIVIQVQPNPASSQVSVLLENTARFSNLQMHIIKQTGEKLYERQIREASQEELLDISQWASGIYLIIIRSEGKILGSSKLIVE